MMLIVLFESVGIFLLIPLISVTGIFDISTEDILILDKVKALFLRMPETMSLILILGLYLLLIIGQSVFKRNQTILSVKIEEDFYKHISDETYKNLLHANWGFYLKKRKSDIINIMTNEIFYVSDGINVFFRLLSALIFTFIQLCIAFYLSPGISTFVLLFGIILLVFSKIFVKKSKSLGEESFQLGETYIAGITDQFNGIKDIKSNSSELSHLDWFFSLSEKMKKNNMKSVILHSNSQMIYKIVSAFLISILAFITIQMFSAEPAQLMLIMVIFSRLWPRFREIQSQLEDLNYMIPSIKAVAELQKECSEMKELNNLANRDVQSLEVKYGLSCHNVYFKYEQNSLAYTLENINITIPVNRMTAIVGKSGAGKSTLIDLLMGLNQPDCGEVMVDGTPLKNEHLLAFRQSISYIPQDPFLFNTTIRHNMKIINPNADEEEMWEALCFAAANEFVQRLPQGLDTLIGDRGIRLSGGERQRLVLARAILRKPSILILDEATSALDTDSEAKIQKSIEQLKGKMTIVVIAHRLSTIRNADQVVVMNKGNIIQTGEYDQLAREKRGMFSHLLENQIETTG